MMIFEPRLLTGNGPMPPLLQEIHVENRELQPIAQHVRLAHEVTQLLLRHSLEQDMLHILIVDHAIASYGLHRLAKERRPVSADGDGLMVGVTDAQVQLLESYVDQRLGLLDTSSLVRDAVESYLGVRSSVPPNGGFDNSVHLAA